MIHDPFSKILGDPQDRHPYDECTFITTDRRQTDRRNGEHVVLLQPALCTQHRAAKQGTVHGQVAAAT